HSVYRLAKTSPFLHNVILAGLSRAVPKIASATRPKKNGLVLISLRGKKITMRRTIGFVALLCLLLTSLGIAQKKPKAAAAAAPPPAPAPAPEPAPVAAPAP